MSNRKDATAQAAAPTTWRPARIAATGPSTAERREGAGEPAVEARGLSLSTLVGPVYRGIDLVAYPGQAVALRGRAGSGKTALLLTIAGRMRPSSGSLRVAGLELPRERRRAFERVGMSEFARLNPLQDNLLVRKAIAAEFELRGKRADDASIARFARSWYLEDILGKRVKELDVERRVQLGIALAFVGDPAVVVVDDIEGELTVTQSHGLMDLLAERARALGVAVIVGVVERSLADRADAVLYMLKEDEEHGA